MERDLNCLRCRTEMRFVGREKFQLGQTGWLLGDLSNLLSGALDLLIYTCPKCGKVEFFRPMEDEEGYSEEVDRIAQIKCPKCGVTHDMDYPKCPNCKYDYSEE